jgi:hypothetical protein
MAKITTIAATVVLESGVVTRDQPSASSTPISTWVEPSSASGR